MKKLFLMLTALCSPLLIFASDTDLTIPNEVKSQNLLYWGFSITGLGLLFALLLLKWIRKLPAHRSMLDVSQVIFQTCRTYLKLQGKLLAKLFLGIAVVIALYFGFSVHVGVAGVFTILSWTVIGIMGSYAVAAFGIRVNTLANSRMAFASLQRKPLKLLNIPLNAGMSIGVLLISVELTMMLFILLFMPGELAGACFIGFAIGESLGATVLRIGGGIFTKIADIGSDHMKVAYKIDEDDPRNPGTIADCVGDNAGDSVGPTADGFETYGITGVALITFIVLGVGGKSFGMTPEATAHLQVQLLVWIFAMRILMIGTSIIGFWINAFISKIKYKDAEDIDFEIPLTRLVWITSILSIGFTFLASYLLIPNINGNLNMWWVLSIIISFGTIGGAVIPEITKIFTSTKSEFVEEVVDGGKEGGSPLVILSGFVTGNFSAFWMGFTFVILMFLAHIVSTFGLGEFMMYPSIFGLGLVAFGFLSMGPATIAVDSYGPVTDNAQSVYELSLISEHEEAKTAEIKKDFGFVPDYKKAKRYLEVNDAAGNTFKATAKPVLIGTAVAGATIIIFSQILEAQKTLGVEIDSLLSIANPYTLVGLMMGGAVVFWFTGAATQAVTTGAFRAVRFIKGHINLDPDAPKKADEKSSSAVVAICTKYAQKGLSNIFAVIFFSTLAMACFSTSGKNTVGLFIGYLLGITIVGFFQAVFMANAGAAWDNAKKIVEVNMVGMKGTPLHEATVVGDIVGDPFKDTTSVSLNPVIKFTMLFGLIARGGAMSENFRDFAPYFGIIFALIGLFFVYRSFHSMRITASSKDEEIDIDIEGSDNNMKEAA